MNMLDYENFTLTDVQNVVIEMRGFSNVKKFSATFSLFVALEAYARCNYGVFTYRGKKILHP